MILSKSLRHENPEREFPNSRNYPNFLIACKCSVLTRNTGPRRRDIGLFICINVIPGLFSGQCCTRIGSRSLKIISSTKRCVVISGTMLPECMCLRATVIIALFRLDYSRARTFVVSEDTHDEQSWNT